MGVRRLFSRGGQIFSRGGARTYFLPKKQQKRYYFSPKSLKTYYFLAGQGGGQEPPLPSPTDAHVFKAFQCHNKVERMNKMLENEHKKRLNF